jgi:hypothetical protein
MTVTIDTIFQYGSLDSEKIGDCRLTDDNKYLVGVLSTNHQSTQSYTKMPGNSGLSLGPGFQTAPLFDNSCNP